MLKGIKRNKLKKIIDMIDKKYSNVTYRVYNCENEELFNGVSNEIVNKSLLNKNVNEYEEIFETSDNLIVNIYLEEYNY